MKSSCCYLAAVVAFFVLFSFGGSSALAQTGMVDSTHPAMSSLSANPEIARALLDFGAITPTTLTPSGLGIIVDCGRLAAFVNAVDAIIEQLEEAYQRALASGDPVAIDEAGAALANARNVGTNVHTVARAIGGAAGCPCI